MVLERASCSHNNYLKAILKPVPLGCCRNECLKDLRDLGQVDSTSDRPCLLGQHEKYGAGCGGVNTYFRVDLLTLRLHFYIFRGAPPRKGGLGLLGGSPPGSSPLGHSCSLHHPCCCHVGPRFVVTSDYSCCLSPQKWRAV